MHDIQPQPEAAPPNSGAGPGPQPKKLKPCRKPRREEDKIKTWDEAYEKLRGPLLAYVRSLALGYGLSPDGWNGAEDIVQEIYEDALKQWDQMVDPQAWLYGVARRKVGRRVTEATHRSDKDPNDDATAAQATWSSLATTDDEQQHDVNEVFDTLPKIRDKRQRIAIRWRYFGYSYEEIAEKLEVPRETVKCLARQARIEIRNLIGDLSGTTPSTHRNTGNRRRNALAILPALGALAATAVILIGQGLTAAAIATNPAFLVTAGLTSLWTARTIANHVDTLSEDTTPTRTTTEPFQALRRSLRLCERATDARADTISQPQTDRRPWDLH